VRDEDVARLHGVEISALIRAVQRDREPSPGDFMFQQSEKRGTAPSMSSCLYKASQSCVRFLRTHNGATIPELGKSHALVKHTGFTIPDRERGAR